MLREEVGVINKLQRIAGGHKKAEADAEAKKKERLALLDHSRNTKAAKSFLMNNLPMGPPSKRS